MQQSPLRNSRSLPPDVRVALESLLGRALKDNESISIRTFEAQEAPGEAVREAALAGLKRHFEHVDEQLKDVSHSEHEEAIEEALRSVRPDCRP
jgi:hypothetical protein